MSLLTKRGESVSSIHFDENEILKVARLAQLKLSPDEALELSTQLKKVIDHFDEITAVDTTGIEPLITPSEIEFFSRDDVVVQETTTEDIVANAPDKMGNLFKVPPVV